MPDRKEPTFYKGKPGFDLALIAAIAAIGVAMILVAVFAS
jgi:hypothetical protein